jgi:hypothetical protein
MVIFQFNWQLWMGTEAKSTGIDPDICQAAGPLRTANEEVDFAGAARDLQRKPWVKNGLKHQGYWSFTHVLTMEFDNNHVFLG